ncbi:uncharacterized protein LOC108465455 [Gossypium arboreum]|uniref:uncharacterized protein LOC108465455 n=1 Tax=Gossypium arboreum TaxID=29729 RepID=UPI000819376D|nr:uncharacterized protein LOC108465455 [Gossypium arboreum]
MKKNLISVLSYEKLKIKFDNKCLLATQAEARKRWEKSNEMDHCYMMANVTSTLHKQLESYKTAKTILDKLEDMFECQATVARQSAITNLVNVQQKLGTQVKDHMITLMVYFTKAMDNETNLDQNTQIEKVFKRLSKEFAGFQAACNLGNKKLTLTQLIKELQS